MMYTEDDSGEWLYRLVSNDTVCTVDHPEDGHMSDWDKLVITM
jgi:hypothetical protein